MFYKHIYCAILAIFLTLCLALSARSLEDDLIERLDLVESDAIDIVRLLAEEGGYGVVFASGERRAAKVTLHMANVSALEAIDRALTAAGLRYTLDGKNIIISALPADPAGAVHLGEWSVLTLNNIFADEAEAVLAKASPDVASVTGPAPNEIVLKGERKKIERARDIIKRVDVQRRQVLIEARVIEVSESGMRDLGVRWGRDEGSLRFAIDKNTGDVSLTEDVIVALNALVTEGRAEVLANPSIVAMNGKEAGINIGSRIPYAVPASSTLNGVQWTVQYIDAGVSLKILPKISGDNFVIVKLRPEVSSISEWKSTSAGEFPVITTRNAESEVRVQDGGTVIIGGLINRSTRENLSKIPLLGDIPVIGYLFQSMVSESRRTEVIFLITVRLV